MDFILFYFSGTGNTQLIAQQIQYSLQEKKHDVELISIEDYDAIQKTNFNNKVIGFGFPVYKFSYPDLFNPIFEIMNTKCSENPIFLFCTYARFPANCFYDFSKQLTKKFRLIGKQAFKAPSNGISARLPNTDFQYQSVMFFEDQINQKIDLFTNTLIENLIKNESFNIHIHPQLFNKLQKKLVKQIEQTKYPLLQIDEHRCIHCGICANDCPQYNLIIKKRNVQIIDTKDCLHCLRCMHHCPQNAISFGKLTRGENRYTFKQRNKFFKNATENQNPYWEKFASITRRWRKDTIRYWRTHRKHPEL